MLNYILDDSITVTSDSLKVLVVYAQFKKGFANIDSMIPDFVSRKWSTSVKKWVSHSFF